MKQSNFVYLAVLGSMFGLHYYATPSQRLLQQRYSSREDCQNDWIDPAQCSPQPGGGYFGPRYYWDSSSRQAIAVGADGTARPTASRISATGSSLAETFSAGHITRGGFGRFGGRFGLGG